MRLSDRDIAAITDTAAALFGRSATVRLFGSRLDDTLSDGDIDLLIEVDQGRGAAGRESAFRDSVGDALGDVMLDVLVRERGRPLRPIERLAVATGVPLGPQMPERASRTTETAMAKLARDLVSEAVTMADRNLDQLLWLRPRLGDLLPLSGDRMADLGRERLIEIDAFL